MGDYFETLESEEIDLMKQHSVEVCVAQVTNATFHGIISLLFLAFVYKLIKHSPVHINKRVVVHVLTMTILVGWFTKQRILTAFLFHAFTAFSLNFAYQGISGQVVLAVNIAGMIIIQLSSQYKGNDDYFLSIRGMLMMHVMRLSTVVFQVNSSTAKRLQLDDLANYIEYIYYPPFITFGPYLTYEQFHKMLQKRWSSQSNEIGTALKAIFFIVIGVVFSTVSACCFEMYLPTSQFIEDAMTAMSFRYSHYFVSFVARAMAVSIGSEVVVTNPFSIEFARSPLQIVSEWNKPFHTFLHEYIFQRRYFNSTGSNVFFTFAVSALLHGLDFQMAITLLALGFIAYCETLFRKKLAARLSMCIAAKPCKTINGRPACSHRRKNSGLATLINVLFAILSMYHLVFTGMPFTDEYSPNGYPYDHAISIWKTHNYASIIISIFFFLFSRML